MSFFSWISLFSFLSIFCQLYHATEQCIADSVAAHIVFDSGNYAEIASIVSTGVKKSFLLKKIVFDSEVLLSMPELNYLMGLKEGDLVSVEQFSRAIFYLFKKNSSQKITCSLVPHGDGFGAHVFIYRAWIFKSVVIKGVFFGKDMYRQHYLLESGDFFDEEKHAHSIKKIIKLLHTEGYYSAKIDDTVHKNNVEKKISVSLSIDKGPRYVVRSIALAIENIVHESNAHEIDNVLSDDDRELLRTKLLSFYEKKIVGVFYSKELLNQETLLCKKYLAQKGYPFAKIKLTEQVDVSTLAIKLMFHVDLQKKKQFVFTGNSFFSDDFLCEQLLIFGHSSWLLPASILAEQLESMYRKKGFFDSKVMFVEEVGAIFFTINEGTRYAIKKIVLQGVDKVNYDFIKQSFFSPIVRSKWYDDEQLEGAIDRLLSYYFKQGFWYAVFLQKKFNCLGRKKEYEVVITIDEGARSYFNSISLEIDASVQLPSPLIFSQILPQPCTTDFIEGQKEVIVRQLEKQEFSDFSVHPEISENEEGVALVWKIDLLKKKTNFGKTVINGRGSLSFDAIMRELMYKEGQLWDRKKIKDSFMRLNRLDIFEHIHFYPDYSVGIGNDCPIVLKLKKNETCELRMRGGLGTGIIGKKYHFKGVTYTAGGTFIYRNPTNNFDLLRLEVDYSTLQQSVKMSYVYPWIGALPIDSLFQLYINKSQYLGIVYYNHNLYSLFRQGFLAEFSYDAAYAYMTINTGIEWMKIQVNNQDFQPQALMHKKIAQAIEFNDTLLGVKTPYFYCEPTLVVDCLDDLLYPTYGLHAMISLKGVVPLMRSQFDSLLRCLIQQSCFVPLRSLVMALRIKCGYLFCRSFRNVVPSERFYLGGAHSVRGYDTNMCPPYGQLINDQDEIEYIPQGGTMMIQGTVEARVPLYGNLGAVLFHDMGYLSNKPWREIFHEPLFASTGIGVRLKTPIGRLCLDLACKWLNGYPSISQRIWFLTFEQDF